MQAESILTELEKRSITRLSNKESNQMTRECIQSALVELMQTTPFDKITVTSLVNKSGVSRMAFYRNYATKQDVLESITGGLYDSVSDLMKQTFLSHNADAFYEKFFDMFGEYYTLFDLMIQAGLKSENYLHIEESICEEYRDSDAVTRYRAATWWGAFQSVVSDWYAHGRKEGNAEIAEICREIMPPLPMKEEIVAD